MEKSKKKRVKIKIEGETQCDIQVSEEDEFNYIKRLIGSRNYSAYTKGRKKLKESFESPKSEREWWRVTLKETPVPGSYQSRDFLQLASMNPIRATYNFSGQGRQRLNMVTRDGLYLLPGAYKHRDFLELSKDKKINSCFKSSGRKNAPNGYKDKDLNVPPWQYQVVQPATTTTKLCSFKNQSPRFTGNILKQHDAPPPGTYNPFTPSYRYQISSCFRSETPRFKMVRNKDPGPGTYQATTFTFPQTATLQNMAKLHGLFFRQAFEM